MKRSVLSAAVMLFAANALGQGRPDLVEESLRDTGRAYVPYQMLVQFRADTDASNQGRALRLVGARVEETVIPTARRRDGRGDLQLVNLPPGMPVATAVRVLGQTAEVDFAEPNWIYHHQLEPNDLYYQNGSLWGMYGDISAPANAFGSQTAEAASNNCSGVWVGVIDEGYMHTHEDLAANAATNPGEIPGDGIDNDGNGLIDDVFGWDFVSNDASIFDGVEDDHGTHVAGTIGGVGNNGLGVAGVCWNVNLLGAKFLGKSGGTTANAIKAVDYFTNLKTRGKNSVPLVATNNSWGGGGFSQALKDAIDRAGKADILFIAAAGNSKRDNDIRPNYPSNYESGNIIAVASITSTGTLSSFSNYGLKSVHICAPGSTIMSTLPVRSGNTVVSGYGNYSGTSMATPHVTGAAALYKARHPSATAGDIKAAILDSAEATSACAGITTTGGRLNISGF